MSLKFYGVQRATRVTCLMNKTSRILVLPVIVLIFILITQGTNTDQHFITKNERSANKKTWLLVMCTTLRPSNDRYIVHKNTMNNWNQLGEDILPVLFLDLKYTQVKKEFEQKGWVVFPIDEAMSEGYPVLRHFFAVITRHFRSKYVGYANADILFNNDLAQTLQLMEKYRPFVLRQNELLISGSRYDVKNISDKDFSTSDKILQIKIEDSTRHSPMGQDYFITDSYYTWDMLPPIVIGKQRIDNWVLINAFENEHFGVDASEAITALHQTVDKGSWESRKWNSNLTDPKYNENVLHKIQDFIYFQTGNLQCLPYSLNYTVSKELVLMQRPEVAKFCKKQNEMIGILRKRQEVIDIKLKLEKEKALKQKSKQIPKTSPTKQTEVQKITKREYKSGLMSSVTRVPLSVTRSQVKLDKQLNPDKKKTTQFIPSNGPLTERRYKDNPIATLNPLRSTGGKENTGKEVKLEKEEAKNTQNIKAANSSQVPKIQLEFKRGPITTVTLNSLSVTKSQNKPDKPLKLEKGENKQMPIMRATKHPLNKDHQILTLYPYSSTKSKENIHEQLKVEKDEPKQIQNIKSMKQSKFQKLTTREYKGDRFTIVTLNPVRQTINREGLDIKQPILKKEELNHLPTLQPLKQTHEQLKLERQFKGGSISSVSLNPFAFTKSQGKINTRLNSEKEESRQIPNVTSTKKP